MFEIIVRRGAAVDAERKVHSTHATHADALKVLKRRVISHNRGARDPLSYNTHAMRVYGHNPILRRIEKGYYSEDIDDPFYPNLYVYLRGVTA